MRKLILICLLSFCAVGYGKAIAHWKMNDDAASATVIDETGSHNGTYKDANDNVNTDTGASTGKINGALDFDGDEYIEVADHTVFSPALTPFSISAWVYMHDAAWFYIVGKATSEINEEWNFYVHNSGKLMCIFKDTSTQGYLWSYYNTPLTDMENQWIHVVVTYDGGVLSSSIKLYLNGSRIDDTRYAFGNFIAVENRLYPVQIGRFDATYADGLIDNVMIFDTALTQMQITPLYNNGHGTEIVADADPAANRSRRGRTR